MGLEGGCSRCRLCCYSPWSIAAVFKMCMWVSADETPPAPPSGRMVWPSRCCLPLPNYAAKRTRCCPWPLHPCCSHSARVGGRSGGEASTDTLSYGVTLVPARGCHSCGSHLCQPGGVTLVGHTCASQGVSHLWVTHWLPHTLTLAKRYATCPDHSCLHTPACALLPSPLLPPTIPLGD